MTDNKKGNKKERKQYQQQYKLGERVKISMGKEPTLSLELVAKLIWAKVNVNNKK